MRIGQKYFRNVANDRFAVLTQLNTNNKISLLENIFTPNFSTGGVTLSVFSPRSSDGKMLPFTSGLQTGKTPCSTD